MKKKYIKNKYTLLTIITFLFCFNYSTIFSLPGDIVDPLIHKGAGEQEIGYLKLGDTTASGASGITLEVVSNDSILNSLFDKTSLSTKFINIYGAWFPKSLVIGLKSLPTQFNLQYSHSQNTILGLSWPSVIVGGNVLSTKLNTTGGNTTGNKDVCVSSRGRIQLCGVASVPYVPPALSYSWDSGVWGSCTTTTPTAGSCTGTYQVGTKINWNGADYNWSSSASYYSTNAGDDNTPSVDIGTSVLGLTYSGGSSSSSCYRIYLGSDSKWKYKKYNSDYDQFGIWCLWNFQSDSNEYSLTNTLNTTGASYRTVTNSCAAATDQGGNPLDQQACTDQQYAGCTWTPSTSSSSQTRTVVCKDSNGLIVADSFCTAAKPTTTQNC